MNIKVITGFREDQFHLISMNEAHKAYFLFMNPEQRGVFSNGVALVGRNIQAIEPDYHGYMGWNQGHKLTTADWDDLEVRGVKHKYQELMSIAKEAANIIEVNPMLAQVDFKQIVNEYRNNGDILSLKSPQVSQKLLDQEKSIRDGTLLN